MSSGSCLSPQEHAAFAVSSRLISCLVTEQLLRSIYLPITDSLASGVLVVLSKHLSSEKPVLSRTLRVNDIYVLVPLRHAPVFAPISVNILPKHGRPVGLIDPLDMLPQIYELSDDETDPRQEEDALHRAILSCFSTPLWDVKPSARLRKTFDGVQLWHRFVDGVIIQDGLRDAIANELQSSFEHQLASYLDPPRCPTLKSTPIEWEQSLLAGHPTHPMHRARALPSGHVDYDWYHPQIRFVRVPRAKINMYGSFEVYIQRLVAIASQRCGKTIHDDPHFVVMPVHELQVPNIVSKFSDAEVLDTEINLLALAQSSIRTVVIPNLPQISLKLSIGVKISSALRTISHFTAEFGPRFSREIVPKLTIDTRILSIAREPASAIYAAADPEIKKHFTAIFREEIQPEDGQALIVSAALLEMDHAGSPIGISALETACKLDTFEKRARFLNRYIQLACEALLPPLVNNGVAFEAHAQNVLVRVDNNTGEPLGFVIRDLGGLRIHPETLCRSTGVDFQFLPEHCIATATLEEIYPKFYHTFVHNHIQRLIRILGMHTNGVGWEMLRTHMAASIPSNHDLQQLWLSPDSMLLPSKCLMRMRMRDSYREVKFAEEAVHPPSLKSADLQMVYVSIPNMVQYRPE
ncbi:hypothetical protein H0H92_009222 [Tricholoma furcatifolium]|nr:hypothetical protein H0H92_009222 [Tricholoma furcatifolium]